jgi:hypothetical protein
LSACFYRTAAGVIALDLAKELLELHPNSYALVVSHENITNNYYGGKDKSMLICNVSARHEMRHGCACCLNCWLRHLAVMNSTHVPTYVRLLLLCCTQTGTGCN